MARHEKKERSEKGRQRRSGEKKIRKKSWIRKVKEEGNGGEQERKIKELKERRNEKRDENKEKRKIRN